MRLLSATVRAYRLHQETSVVFDPHRTLIGGRNEAGKSTLAEALHRALFLKAKGNTTDHRAMKSTIHPGTPEVELSFLTGGVVYQLKKRFGISGDATLTPSHGMTLTGEAAETELARLLGVEAGASGKVAVGQWSHLWVWQGQSGDDPTPHATSQKDGLLHRLQTLGGAAAMQSERDSRTAAAVAAAYEESFTATGKVKANSLLAQAEAAVEAAGAAETVARSRAALLEESVQTFTAAGEELDRLGRDLKDLSAQQDQAIRQDALIRQRREEEATLIHADTAAAAGLHTLEQQETQLAGIRQQLTALASELAPLDAATETLMVSQGAARQAAEAAVRAFEAASNAVAGARQQRDLAQSWLHQHETAVQLAVLTQRAVQVAEHQSETEKLQLARAALPPVDAAGLAVLQKLDTQQHAVSAALTAMAAGLELIAADGPVMVGGKPLAPGETQILTEESELQLGTAYRLRIRPGGGTSLEAAREKERQARQEWQTALEKYGVRSFEEASAITARRADLASRIMAGQAALNSLQASTLPRSLAEAQVAHATALADTARRAAAVETAPVEPGAPTAGSIPSPETARVLLGETVRHLDLAESTVVRTKTLRDAADRTAAEGARVLLQHQESLRDRHTRHTGLLAQLDLLTINYGDDSIRATALQQARDLRRVAADRLAAIRQILEELQPDHTTRTLERLQRSLGELGRQRTAAETRRAVAADQLRSDGSHDPAATLALATARVAEATENVQRLRRQAESRRLLHQAFTAEQTAMADRFTRPLADCISGYLECLFGPGTRAAVVLENQAFTGLQLIRPGHAGGAISFDSLSGGTREQTAAAVRLAMAEVLAGSHGGTLPVVFDDAFAHSDATRLRQLQSMLDLAASRGLQILLLTHQPADYAALGAVGITLG
jgi:energy-coupling factor transporter ATP-binding protein EcfA2